MRTGNPLDQPLPLNSDFWEKKSQYYSHGESSEQDVRLAEEIVVERLRTNDDKKAQRLEAQLELIAPVVDQAERKWTQLADLEHLNFTAIEWEIENELPEPNDRTWRKGRGRGARGLPAFLGNAVKLFDLKQVVKELETSVMTSVSCSACKAGTVVRCRLTAIASFKLSNPPLHTILVVCYRCRSTAALR